MLRRLPLAGLLAVILAVLLSAHVRAEGATLRVGVLKYGTVNWELDVIRHHGLDRDNGFTLEITPLALKDAAAVAVQGGAVDIIVSDWLWVARQRAEGRLFSFAPYSRAEGSLMVRPDAGVTTFADLKGKRLGVAGGALDKSWLLLRAYARQQTGTDAAELVEPNFAAPPLLNQLVLKGELPATLNFWHFAARLEAAGMRRLLSIDEVLGGLGIDRELPMVGWVFKEDWAEANRAAVDGFLRASDAAKAILRDSDAEWERLRPMMKAEDEATFVALREGFRAGIPQAGVEQAERAARQAYGVLAREGGEALVGKATELASGVFWRTAAQ
ncbi:MAG: transporter substrate-binding domain-containing protein [Rhodocyclaceae bacterium]|nr:transporter substrate-binding domain-containing protein [Rhodocyclaceae bacterium]